MFRESCCASRPRNVMPGQMNSEPIRAFVPHPMRSRTLHFPGRRPIRIRTSSASTPGREAADKLHNTNTSPAFVLACGAIAFFPMVEWFNACTDPRLTTLTPTEKIGTPSTLSRYSIGLFVVGTNASRFHKSSTYRRTSKRLSTNDGSLWLLRTVE